ncbi:hypothetical protein CIG2463D_0498 [Campylobacter iguaniorum]|uniref:hypothetical protein n=1 Tax=Campylobacter iguaniorum TaxID=1244531 RepID=UPI00073A2BA5|nr:hypothetical protein [Campylobacter iguaniorum]ALV24098.1 hypothetical protein CIG2463D_0498 [Campylobacter iguaniorum]
MKCCIVIYDKVNLLSFAKIHDFFARKKLDFDVVSLRDSVVCEHEFRLFSPRHSESLYGYDIVALPDGMGALNLRYDDIFLSWIKSASNAKVKLAIDLGALIYAGAGFLESKSAVIRGGYKNALGEYCSVSDVEFYKNEDIISMLDTPFAWQELEMAIDG